MRIRLLSDLHLEGNNFYYDYAGEDIVILAGDIHTPTCRGRFEELLKSVPINVRIIKVAGNHTYYGDVFEEVNEYLKNLENVYHNFTFLNNTFTKIDDVAIFGGTMFTDWQLYNDAWTAREFAKNGIADFHWIDTIGRDWKKRHWNTEDHLAQHLLFKEKLAQWLTQEHEKRIVVTHFVPHPNCIADKWKGNRLNPYFTVNMEEYMGWDGLWLFGHTHDSFDTMVGNTRLVCNPRGYGTENMNGFNNDLILEI